MGRRRRRRLRLQAAYTQPDIQRWRVREIDSLDEAYELIASCRHAWA